jgi:DNA-binding response OmpR family regulator
MSGVPRIVMADDDPGFLRMLAARLENEGYDVVMAGSADEALSKALETTPDLMIMDVFMPGGVSFEFVQRKRVCESIADVPVVFVTADTSDLIDDIAEEFEAAVVLRKPVDFDELLETIERLRPAA